MRLHLTIFDGILIISLVAGSIFLLNKNMGSSHDAKLNAIVSNNDKIEKRIRLSKSDKNSGFTIGPATLEVEKGKIRITNNSCPKKICMQIGWINKPGQTIICIPNKIIVRIEDTKETEKIHAWSY